MKTLSRPGRQSYGVLILLCGCLLLPRSAHAEEVAEAKEVPAARVLSVRGIATLGDRAVATKPPLTRGTELTAGDTIATGPNSAVRILLADRSIIDIGASTVLNVGEVTVTPDRRTVNLRVTVGLLWARVSSFFGGGSEFEVVTQTAVAGVRGTELIVEVNGAGKTVVTVVRGAVEMSSRAGEQREHIGPMMTATFDGTGTIELQPADAVRVAAIGKKIAPRPTFTPTDREAIREQGLAPGPKKPGRAGPARLNIIDTPAPPLDAEPGAFGAVDVNGKVELRE